MNSVSYTSMVITTGFLLFTGLYCNNVNSEKELNQPKSVTPSTSPVSKPVSSYADTLIINFPAAVFYHPDSLQLLNIKAQYDPMLYDGMMHEFYYQMRNARSIIKKNWSALSIIEATHYRYILFVKKDSSKEFVDLDKKNDALGLYIFNGVKQPLFADMTNLETALSFYMND